MQKNLSIEEIDNFSEEYKKILLKLNFSKSELKELSLLKSKMDTDKNKGKVFENMVEILFKNTLFKLKSNAYTSSNEIDLVIELNTYAKLFKIYCNLYDFI